jgi:hypothetical protein
LAGTRITDHDEAASFLSAWFGSRMIGLRGKFGLVLTTGEILMITSIGALDHSLGGTILLDGCSMMRAFPTGSIRRGRRSTISMRRGRGAITARQHDRPPLAYKFPVSTTEQTQPPRSSQSSRADRAADRIRRVPRGNSRALI